MKTLFKYVDANKYVDGSDSCFEGQLNGDSNLKRYHVYFLVSSYYVLATQTVVFKCALCFKCEKM